jgi:cytochrome c oxidase assembly protein subunit 15
LRAFIFLSDQVLKISELSLAYQAGLTGRTNPYQKAVAAWLYIGVGMLLFQIVLGGVTRLTGSGLSITEWNVVTGALPPLSEARWMEEFDKYKQTPQYLILNSDFQLPDFKFIFFWEWLHRFWARLIAVAFLFPFIYFIAKRAISSSMVKPLLTLFMLGALQGAVGWIMVASGLTGDAIYVKPVKLAVHFVLALGLISYAFWFALSVSGVKTFASGHTSKSGASSNWKRFLPLTWTIMAVLLLQLLFGALMAGHKAATAAPTWPTINGAWIPARLFQSLSSLVEDRITIHFMHRSLAYLLVFLVIFWTVSANRLKFSKPFLPLLLIILQLMLGIFAVLVSPSIIPNRWVGFDWLAIFHQITGMTFLLTMIYMLYQIYGRHALQTKR